MGNSTMITFPAYSGIRCLMMPYIQGDPDSLPAGYEPYADILATTYIDPGTLGFLTIDESPVVAGMPHRASRAKYDRALHTEAGLIQGIYNWGVPVWGPTWGGRPNVTLDFDCKVLLSNNMDRTCAIWKTECLDTSVDGDIGHLADHYPYEDATIMTAGEVQQIGILTPHESLPVEHDGDRQFLRIMSSGVHGREPYFTPNPLFPIYE